MRDAPRDRHATYTDYLTWPDEVRYELLAGHPRLMAPAPSVDHQTIATEIAYQIRNALEHTPCRILMTPVDVLLFAGKADDDANCDTVVQPDALIVCDPQKLTPRCVRGAPDWVLEVISPSSARIDQIDKLALYERAGVREYWLAHPTDRILTIYRHDGSGYGRPRIVAFSGETALDILPDIVIQWAPVTERLLGSPEA